MGWCRTQSADRKPELRLCFAPRGQHRRGTSHIEGFQIAKEKGQMKCLAETGPSVKTRAVPKQLFSVPDGRARQHEQRPYASASVWSDGGVAQAFRLAGCRRDRAVSLSAACSLVQESTWNVCLKSWSTSQQQCLHHVSKSQNEVTGQATCASVKQQVPQSSVTRRLRPCCDDEALLFAGQHERLVARTVSSLIWSASAGCEELEG